jgi:probable HAF family extracellular repeat protein
MRHLATLTLGAAAFVLSACADEPTRPLSPSTRRPPPAAPAAVGPAFAVTARDLGTLGGVGSRALGINDHGEVVGASLTAGGARRGFRWTAAGGLRALPTLAGRNCQAQKVNERGQVTGFCQNAAGQVRAVLWSPSGRIRNLGTLPGGRSSQATDVNDGGVVVGYSGIRLPDGAQGTHAFRWTAAGGMEDLTPGLGRSDCDLIETSFANRINRSGAIVGTWYLDVECGFAHPFAWGTAPFNGNGEEFLLANGINDLGEVVGTTWELLGTIFAWRSFQRNVSLLSLCGPSPYVCDKFALAINDAGIVVGASRTVPGGPTHAVIWTATSAIQDLGTLPGGSESWAYDINALGQAVGRSTTAGGATHATLWTLAPR